jgi:hypothetical protein
MPFDWIHLNELTWNVLPDRKADSTFKYGNGFTYTQYSSDGGKTWKQLDYYRKKM